MKALVSVPAPARSVFVPDARFCYEHGLIPTRLREHVASFGTLWPGSDHLLEWTASFDRESGLLRIRRFVDHGAGYWKIVFEGTIESEDEFRTLAQLVGWQLQSPQQ